MRFTITETPTTLWQLVRDAGYQIHQYADAGYSVQIVNDTRSYDVATSSTIAGPDNGPLLIEKGDLNRHLGVAPDGTRDFIDVGPEAGWYVWPQQAERQKKYIAEAEAMPIFNGGADNFVTYDLDRIHLRACTGKTLTIYVNIE